MITVCRDSAFAPCCFIICQALPTATPGVYDWDTREESRTVLVQCDVDFPAVAQAFGFTGREDDVDGARAYLDECAEAGTLVSDPGYFTAAAA